MVATPGTGANSVIQLGVTSHLYTDDFDDEYFEVNLNAGYSYFTFDVSIGGINNFGELTLDYD